MILGILLNLIAEWKETVKYVKSCGSGISVLPCKSGWGMDVVSEASDSEIYGTVLGIPRGLVETFIGEAR